MAVLTSNVNGLQPDGLFEFTHGIPQDKRLARQEIAVQKAWLKGLQSLDNLFTADDVKQIESVLDEALNKILMNEFEWNVRDEDIHMHLEKYVTERLGDLGKKMHLGRSRNDLIATTLRLFVRDIVTEVETGVSNVISALKIQSDNYIDIIIPGATHLQHGQPVRFGHVLMSYAQQFKRDLNKLAYAKTSAMATMPLGSAALAGTPLDLDLQAMADELGFEQPTLNSYDAVGDRDFMLDALDAFASVSVHLARLSEDCIYWSASPVGLLKLPQAWSTGSSIMPNKRNPDVPELTRGRSAHIIGAQTDGHMLVRTVPTSYGSDLHEMKKVIMNSFDETQACLNVWHPFIASMDIDSNRAAELCNLGHILATEIADDLVDNGVPFRDSYKIVASLVGKANEQNIQVHELDIDTVNAILTDVELNTLSSYNYTPEKAVERRTNNGGTAKAQVKAEIGK